MIINHVLVGAKEFEKSAAFYSALLGFEKTRDDPGTQGGVVLAKDSCELLVIPFPENRLPNPTHFAFEVSTTAEFGIYDPYDLEKGDVPGIMRYLYTKMELTKILEEVGFNVRQVDHYYEKNFFGLLCEKNV